jgi:hypothetical protein
MSPDLHLSKAQDALLEQLMQAQASLPPERQRDFVYRPSIARRTNGATREEIYAIFDRGQSVLIDGRYFTSRAQLPKEYDTDTLEHEGLPAGGIDVTQADINALSEQELICFRTQEKTHSTFYVTPKGEARILTQSNAEFTHALLDWKFSERLNEGLDYIHRLNSDQVAAIDTERLTSEIEHFAIVPPRVRADQCKRDEKTVELVDQTFDRKTGETGHYLLLPVDGEAEWLEEVREQMAPDSHPIGFVDEHRNQIQLNLSLSPEDPAGTLKRKLDERVTLVQQYAGYVAKRIIDFNTELARNMTEGFNSRKAAIEKARREIESLEIPAVADSRHVESAIQIQRVMEGLNSRYRRPLTYGEQLFEEVKELIEKNETLDTVTAKLVIEKVDDALTEFGNRHQEKKLQLRNWKSRALFGDTTLGILTINGVGGCF